MQKPIANLHLEGYPGTIPFFVSKMKNKKYYAIFDGVPIHFGDKRYGHYKDKIGVYSNLDHNDDERRRNFRNRFAERRFVVGSPSWFSDKVLW